MYLTLPPGRAIRTGSSRVEWLALLTFLRCKVRPCRCNRRHALCMLIERYFHERTGAGIWVWPNVALIAKTLSTAATVFTTQLAALLFKNGKKQFIYHLCNYFTRFSPLSHFHPYSTLTNSSPKIHSNITLQVLPPKFKFYKWIFPRLSPTDILYKLLSFPTWRYIQPVVAFKLSLLYKY
jgi:hypothetical protein